MPALGESVTEGTVTRWLKQEGDQVAADEPLLEVSTDKVDTEIPSPAAGVLQRIVVGEDETVEVGAELAVIGDGQADGGEQQGQQDAPAGQSRPSRSRASSRKRGSGSAAVLQPDQQQEAGAAAAGRTRGEQARADRAAAAAGRAGTPRQQSAPSEASPGPPVTPAAAPPSRCRRSARA